MMRGRWIEAKHFRERDVERQLLIRQLPYLSVIVIVLGGSHVPDVDLRSPFLRPLVTQPECVFPRKEGTAAQTRLVSNLALFSLSIYGTVLSTLPTSATLICVGVMSESGPRFVKRIALFEDTSKDVRVGGTTLSSHSLRSKA